MRPLDAAETLRPLARDVGPRFNPRKAVGIVRDLPAAHREFLSAMNGLTVFHGLYRIFGVGREQEMNIDYWNALDTWRFAWPERPHWPKRRSWPEEHPWPHSLNDFVFFGGSAFGEQFAYRREESGVLAPEVYHLECVMLTPSFLWPSFEDFLDGNTLRASRELEDGLTLEAVDRRKEIDAAKMWAYAPPLALGGPELVDNIVELPAVTAMTFAGDINSQIDRHPDEDPVAVVPWIDSRGRDRLRLQYEV